VCSVWIFLSIPGAMCPAGVARFFSSIIRRMIRLDDGGLLGEGRRWVWIVLPLVICSFRRGIDMVELDVNDGIAWLTLNRPEVLNALDLASVRILSDHLKDLR